LVASDPAPTIFPDVICKAVPLVEAELIPAGAKPVAVPLFVKVTPDGIVYVSPESPIVADVPLAGDHLSAFISLLIYAPITFIPVKNT
jgi:hypothetical protein